MELDTLQLSAKSLNLVKIKHFTRYANCADSSEFDEEVNYAMMANVDAESAFSDIKISQTTLTFDTDDISKLRIFDKCLHVSYRYQNLENEIIKIENSDL